MNRNQENRSFEDLENNTDKVFSKMPVYRCSCGIEILIIPDLRVMVKAIMKHLTEHKELTGKPLTEEILMQEIVEVIGDVFRSKSL